MTIGIQAGDKFTELGTDDFVHAFFSTVSFRLEPDGWGTRYPILMNRLYQGGLDAENASAAIAELVDVRERLKVLPPSSVVWDIGDLDVKPPWGNDISKDITDMSNYFVTSTGRDFIDVLLDALRQLQSKGGMATLERF